MVAPRCEEPAKCHVEGGAVALVKVGPSAGLLYVLDVHTSTMNPFSPN